MNIRKEKLDLYRAVYMTMKPRLKDVLCEEQAIILHLYLWGKQRSDGEECHEQHSEKASIFHYFQVLIVFHIV